MTWALQTACEAAVKAALPFFPYKANLIAPGAVTASNTGGHSHASTSTAASDVPCLFEELRNPFIQTLSDKKQVTITHRLYMEATAAVLAVTDGYQIAVQALGNEAAFTFTNPIRTEGGYPDLATFHVSIQKFI